MKFLAFVDLHEDKKTLRLLLERAAQPDVDFLICAGDLTQFSRNIRFIMRQFNNLGKKIYLIPGNHETDEVIAEVVPDYPNFVNINNKSVEIGDYVLMGYGGGGFSAEDASFRKISREWYGKFKERKTILVIHGPPFGTKTDLLDGHYVGNKDYRAFIERIQPKLVICGHIHETAGVIDKIGETKVINPGGEGMIVELK
jgi:Icc-related predicted phosphoesterase